MSRPLPPHGKATGPRARRVLVVDDEEGILELVEYHLRRAGFDVLLAETGREALRMALEQQPDLIILDLMLPDLDGFEVCRRIRSESQVPVLMLTARTDDEDKAVGLEIGADAYVTKPFNPRELVARVHALLQRSEEEVAQVPGRLQFGSLEVDLTRKQVRLAGQEVHLTPTEFAMLRVFVEQPGRVWSRSELLGRVWGDDFVGDPRVVDLYVRYLREKLGDDPARPRWLETVRKTPGQNLRALEEGGAEPGAVPAGLEAGTADIVGYRWRGDGDG